MFHLSAVVRITERTILFMPQERDNLDYSSCNKNDQIQRFAAVFEIQRYKNFTCVVSMTSSSIGSFKTFTLNDLYTVDSTKKNHVAD